LTPSITLYSDVTSSAVRNNYSWNRDIVNQIVKPVKWEQIMYKLYMREKEARHPYTYECGPGNFACFSLSLTFFKKSL
jgi:hypothetical protein